MAAFWGPSRGPSTLRWILRDTMQPVLPASSGWAMSPCCPMAALAVSIGLAGGGDSLLLDGRLTPGDLTTVTGDGKLQVALSDTSALAADAGLAGLYTPPVAGSADFRLGADGGVDLDNISATSGATKFIGKLALARDAGG